MCRSRSVDAICRTLDSVECTWIGVMTDRKDGRRKVGAISVNMVWLWVWLIGPRSSSLGRMVGMSWKEGGRKLRRRKARRWTWSRRLLEMAVLFEFERGGWCCWRPVSSTEGRGARTQLRAVGWVWNRVASVCVWSVSIARVRGVKGRGQFGGDGELPMTTVRDGLLFDGRVRLDIPVSVSTRLSICANRSEHNVSTMAA